MILRMTMMCCSSGVSLSQPQPSASCSCSSRFTPLSKKKNFDLCVSPFFCFDCLIYILFYGRCCTLPSLSSLPKGNATGLFFSALVNIICLDTPYLFLPLTQVTVLIMYSRKKSHNILVVRIIPNPRVAEV